MAKFCDVYFCGTRVCSFNKTTSIINSFVQWILCFRVGDMAFVKNSGANIKRNYMMINCCTVRLAIDVFLCVLYILMLAGKIYNMIEVTAYPNQIHLDLGFFFYRDN